jgi:quinol monooxygenase YgiN
MPSIAPPLSGVFVSVVVVATAFPADEHRAEVIAAFEAAIARVHSEEPGCELYALHVGRDRLVMIEKYASREAFAEHGSGGGLAQLRAALEGKLTTAVDVQVLEPHPAGTAGKGAL